VQVDVLGLAHPDKTDSNASSDTGENDARERNVQDAPDNKKSAYEKALDVLYAKAESAKHEIPSRIHSATRESTFPYLRSRVYPARFKSTRPR
jgi:hypothetical protein